MIILFKIITRGYVLWDFFLDRLVSANQSAFIHGRCIHENYILVQQTIKLLHRHQVPSIFLKPDVSKAFESVSWAFLLEILAHLLGFCTGLAQPGFNSARYIFNSSAAQWRAWRCNQSPPRAPLGRPPLAHAFYIGNDALNSLFTKAG